MSCILFIYFQDALWSLQGKISITCPCIGNTTPMCHKNSGLHPAGNKFLFVYLNLHFVFAFNNFSGTTNQFVNKKAKHLSHTKKNWPKMIIFVYFYEQAGCSAEESSLGWTTKIKRLAIDLSRMRVLAIPIIGTHPPNVMVPGITTDQPLGGGHRERYFNIQSVRTNMNPYFDVFR